MRILLAVAVSEERFNSIPDIGLGLLAALARNAGHEVHYVDCLLERWACGDFQAHVRKLKPDLVGIKTYSADLDPVAAMMRSVKEVSPQIVTVAGGPHPSTEVPERLYLQFPHMDYAFAGEAEPGWVPFLERLAAGRTDLEEIPGLIWRDATGTVRSSEKAFVEDLNALPYPAWDLLQPQRYKCGYSFMTTRYPSAPMNFTRGCPYLCTFCGSYLITGRKVRRRSPEHIIEEIRLLRRDFGVQSLDVVDENFVQVRPYVMDLCEKLTKADLGIAWNCPYGVRLDRLDEEMIRTMERAGCFGFSCGVESGTDRILAQIKKHLTVAQIREKVTMVKRVSRIKVQGFFMMGFPDETKQEIEATIDLACSLPFDFVVFSPLRVTPGTQIYLDLVEAGVITPQVDYTGLGHHYFVRSYCPVNDEEMRKLYRKAYVKFYFRPKVIWNLVARQCRSRAQARTLVNGMARLLRRPKSKFDPRKHVAGAAAAGTTAEGT